MSFTANLKQVKSMLTVLEQYSSALTDVRDVGLFLSLWFIIQSDLFNQLKAH